MTLIVGILCTDGVVVASDSAATFGAAGIPTIGQQEVTKIHRLSDSVLFSSTGAVGMAQVIANEIRNSWQSREFRERQQPEQAMNYIGNKIAQVVGPYLQTGNLSRPLVGDCSMSLCKSLVAMPVNHSPCLFNFDFNGAPEQATNDLPFISLGSGQRIADPFLAFLKRLLWLDTSPSLAEGRLAAVWTIDHVRLTNPGGVGGKIQLATLAVEGRGRAADRQPTVTMFSEDELQEPLQQIRAAEDALTKELRAIRPENADALPPPPVQNNNN